MSVDSTRLKVLASLTNEFEAAALVNALANQGIRAKAVGEYTSGFRAEAPGGVSVVVRQDDYPQAEKVLAGVQSEGAEIDWSEVDIRSGQSSLDPHDPMPGADAEPASTCGPTGFPSERRPFQISIQAILFVQAFLCLALALMQGPVDGLGLWLMGATVALIAAGTVQIATDLSLSHARQAWKYAVLVLIFGSIVLSMLLLIRTILDMVVVAT